MDGYKEVLRSNIKVGDIICMEKSPRVLVLSITDGIYVLRQDYFGTGYKIEEYAIRGEKLYMIGNIGIDMNIESMATRAGFSVVDRSKK